jgi:hypothetical protein
MNQESSVPVLPTEAFDAIFRAESLEERVEFQSCDTYDPNNPACNPDGGPPVTTTPEPSTILMAATGLGGVGIVSYLRRRAARRKDEASRDATSESPRD